MSGMDLDAMRDRWASANRDVDAQLTMDVAAVRVTLQRREKNLFQRHSGWLLAGIVAGFALTAVLIAFIVVTAQDLRYVGMAALLLILVVAELVVDWRQWRALSQLDFDRPVLAVRAELGALRVRRLAMVKWIFLTAFFLWLPMLMVFVRGVFGVDLLRVLDPSFIWINQAVTLAVIPLGLGISHWTARRFGQSTGYQGFLDDLAGRSWSRAQKAFDTRQRFEADVQQCGASETLRRRIAAPPPAVLVVPLRALQRRIVLAIVVFAVCVIGSGAFNGLHGGQVPFLVPGVALHLFLVMNLVAAIVHLAFLSRLDFAEPTTSLSAQLGAASAWRSHMARWSLALSPIAVLLLAQVLAKAVLAVNLAAGLPWPALLLGAALLGVLVWRRCRQKHTQSVALLLNALSFGAIKRSAALMQLLTQGDAARSDLN